MNYKCRHISEDENERQDVHFNKDRQVTIEEGLAINSQNNKEFIA